MNKDKAEILGCYIDRLDKKGSIDKIGEFIAKGQASQVITLNAEIAYAAQYDPILRKIINQAALVTPDGIGIVWAAKHLGMPVKERVTGIDMVYELCSQAIEKDWKLYFLGAAPQVAETAADNLKQACPRLNIVGVRDGYFTDAQVDELINAIKQAAPDILLVGLGAPKQEFFIYEHKAALGLPVLVGVGGSFDVIAGVKKRAPDIMIKLNLEWLYRLFAEPSRWRRQLVLPKFVWAILRKGKKAS